MVLQGIYISLRYTQTYEEMYTVIQYGLRQHLGTLRTAEKSLLGMLWGKLHFCIPTTDLTSSTQQALAQEAYKADANVELPVAASGTAHLVQISIWQSVPLLTKALEKDPGKEIISPVYECRIVICLQSAAQLVTFSWIIV